jgi:acetoin utilization protein AcuB
MQYWRDPQDVWDVLGRETLSGGVRLGNIFYFYRNYKLMPYKKPVSLIMSKSPVVANASNKFSQVLKLFSTYSLHHLPIVDENNKLIGIVSSNDIPKVFNELCGRETPIPMTLEAIDAEIKLTDLMTKNPVTISSTGQIDDAFKLLSDKKFLTLPVVDDGVVVGILSGRDILEYVAHIDLYKGPGYKEMTTL